jgi:superfamily I DNA and/or RNA helicase
MKRYIRENDGVYDLTFTGTRSHPEYDTVFMYQYPEGHDEDVDLTEDFGVYPDSVVLLDSEEGNEPPAEMRVIRVRGNSVSVAAPLSESPDMSHLTGGREYSIAPILNTTPYERRKTAVSDAKQLSRTRGVLSGKEMSISDVDVSCTIPRELNSSQSKAVDHAVGAEDVFCIHGPPGTGKTRTLVSIIEVLVGLGCTVLACSHSNQATDNLLVGDSTRATIDESSLHHTAMNEDIEVVRCGSNTKNTVVKNQYMEDTDRGSRPDVVVSTMSAAATLDTDFDVAVVDEATQASQPSSLIPLTMAKKTILAGDHKQLPPYSSSENSESEEMHESLFEYLMDTYDTNISVQLNRQYRMNDEIASFPNKEFYEGSLITDDSCEDSCVGDLSPMAGVHIEGKEKMDDSTKSKYNEKEADVVANQVARIQQEELEPEDIGVITPYTAQIGTISEALRENNRVTSPTGIKIDTVDSFQGSEKEAIVVSFVRSNDGGHSGFLTFPDEGKRRLNVALTRSKRRCVLIGNWETLSSFSETKNSDNSCADVYQRLYRDLQDRGLLKNLEA